MVVLRNIAMGAIRAVGGVGATGVTPQTFEAGPVPTLFVAVTVNV